LRLKFRAWDGENFIVEAPLGLDRRVARFERVDGRFIGHPDNGQTPPALWIGDWPEERSPPFLQTIGPVGCVGGAAISTVARIVPEPASAMARAELFELMGFPPNGA
jgi:hypothetical protein